MHRNAVLIRILPLVVLLLLLASMLSPLAIALAQKRSVEPTPLPKPVGPIEPLKPGKPYSGSIIVEKPSGIEEARKIAEKVVKNSVSESSAGLARIVVARNPITKVEIESSGAAPDSKVKRFDVYLITGDRVIAVYRDGKYSVFIKPTHVGKAFSVFYAGGSLYVVPIGVDLRKFDIQLFNINLLQEYRNLGIDKLPLIVKVRERVPLVKVYRDLERYSIKAIHMVPLHIIHSVAMRVPLNKLAETYRFLARSTDVVYVAPDRIVKALNSEPAKYVVIKPQLYQSVPLIGAPNLWSIGINGSGIKIAILDTGIDPNHPDFYIGNKSKILNMTSFVDFNFDGVPDEPPIDHHGHGTHCAGIAAGTGNYLSILRGVAPGALLLVGKVLSDLGWGYDSWIIRGIEWAVNNSADIISMSLGGPATVGYDPLVDAVNKAVQKGVIVVIAAGNEGPGFFTVSSPGVASGAITVGAVDKELNLAWFSSWGPTPNATLKPDVVAPGVYIASARANGTYMGEPATIYHVYASGTSMATPHVAGYAALVLELLNRTGILAHAESALSATRSEIVKDVIVSTAQDLGYDVFAQGAGFINATRLLYLLNESRLIIVHPARIDLVSSEPGTRTVSIRLYNPFNTSISLTVEPVLLLWSGLENASVPSNAVEVPKNISLAPNSTTEIEVAVNFSAIPAGYHALVLKFVDEDLGIAVAKALIGISKPIVLKVHASFGSEPAYFYVVAQGFSPRLGEVYLEGIDWGWFNYGVGETTLYPLYPDTAYLIEVGAYYLPSNESTIRFGIYYTMLITDNTTTVYNLSIDFAKIKPVTARLVNYTEGDIVGAYGALMNITFDNQSETIELSDVLHSVVTYSQSVEMYYATNATTVSRWGYTFALEPRFFVLKGELQPLYLYKNESAPIAIVYKYFSDVPSGESFVLNLTNVTYTILHAHSALGPKELESACSAVVVFGGEADIDTATCSAAVIPSITVYRVDSNVSISGEAIDVVYIPFGSAYLMIEAYDWLGLDLGNNVSLYAPLAMPRAGSTLWSYATLSRGLDGYNFTYGFVMGQVLRRTILGYYYLEVVEGWYPILYAVMKINGEPIRELYSSTPLAYYLEAFTWRMVDRPNVTTIMTLNLTPASPYLAFHDYVVAEFSDVFTKPNYTGGDYIEAFYYGTGVRDIVPIGGFDPILNYLPNGSVGYILVLFNTPAPYGNVDLNRSSVAIYLIKNSSAIQLPVLDWYTIGPLYGALVAINSSYVLESMEPGAFDLAVVGTYNDSEGVHRVEFSILIKNALYIGIPPYIPSPRPAVLVVGPAGSGAEYNSINEAVEEAPPGSIIEVYPGEYHEELILVDKPLTIIGVGDAHEHPVVVAPHGYPIFIVTSSLSISGLELLPSGRASTPTNASLPLPSSLLTPPPAIAVYEGSMTARNLTIEGYPVAFKLINASGVRIDHVNAIASRFLEVEAPYIATYWNHVVSNSTLNGSAVIYLTGSGKLVGSYVEAHLAFGEFTIESSQIRWIEIVNSSVTIKNSSVDTLRAVGSTIAGYNTTLTQWSGVESSYCGHSKLDVLVVMNSQPIAEAVVEARNSLGKATAVTDESGKATLWVPTVLCRTACTTNTTAIVTASKLGLEASKVVDLSKPPVVITLSLPSPKLSISVKNMFGQPVTKIEPGDVLIVNASYDLITFSGAASINVTLYNGDKPISSIEIPITGEKKGSIEVYVFIPFVRGDYSIAVNLVLEGLPPIGVRWP